MKIERIEALSLTKKEAIGCALRAAREQAGREAIRARVLGGGSFGTAVELTLEDGGAMVVKLLRAEGMMRKEVHDLQLLRAHCPVRMPRVLFARDRGGDIPVDCYGMERIAGKNALFSLRLLAESEAKRRAFAEEVTAALHAVHACTGEAFGDTMHPDCGSWLQYYRPFAEAVWEQAEAMHAAGSLPGKVIAAMRAAMARFDDIFCEEVTKPCLIHGDLNIGNIMVGKGGRIEGFIDPLNSLYADREYDLFQFDNLTGKRFYLRETYLKNYGGSERVLVKLAFYGLWNEVFCYIRSGMLVGLIMRPLVKNMHRRLAEL